MTIAKDETVSTRAALRSFVVAALEVLESIPLDGTELIVPGQDLWVRGENDCYHLREHTLAGWEQILFNHSQVIKSLAAYQEAVGALKADSQIGPQLGGIVGTVTTGSIVEASQLPMKLLWRTARRINGLRFDERFFNDTYDTFESFWRGSTITAVAFAPLNGLRATGLPIELGSDVSLVELTDEEVSAAILFGVIRPIHAQLTRQIAPVCGLRASVVYQKWHTSSDEKTRDKAIELAQALRRGVCEKFDRIVQGLRVFKGGQFAAPMTIIRTSVEGTIHSGTPRMSETKEVLGIGYTLQPANVQLLPELLRRFEQPATRKWLAVALRRFDYAASRSRSDDKITDLMIAAEAIFLHEASAAERGELNFRLALRAAHYVEHEPAAKRAVFKFMKSAYGLRSKLVHGSEPDLRSLKGLAGEKVDLETYVATLEGLVRAALIKAAGTNVPNWEELVLR